MRALAVNAIARPHCWNWESGGMKLFLGSRRIAGVVLDCGGLEVRGNVDIAFFFFLVKR